jgi:hypothetical protein
MSRLFSLILQWERAITFDRLDGICDGHKQKTVKCLRKDDG